MTAYIALLRAVNVGGRKLVMTDLKAVADKLGFSSARTYIASGNLLFTSSDSERKVKLALEAALAAHMGKTAEVMVRTAKEMAAVAKANPFASETGNKVVAIFLDEAPPEDAAKTSKNIADERMALGTREIYVHYPSGQGQSKLRILAAVNGTARNMNTVTKLAELAEEMA
jgi:uncharacterized protein (DUF1697 family)